MMNNHDHQFHPESVDADIDTQLQIQAQAEITEQRHVPLVRAIHEQYMDDPEVLDRAWKRVIQQIQGTEEHAGAEMLIPQQDYRIAKGNRHMQEQGISRNYGRGKTMVKRLSGIGSGLVAALLIASAILIMIYHQQSLSSHSSQTASQQPQTPAPGTKVPGPAASDITIPWMGTVSTQSSNPHSKYLILTPTRTATYTFHTGQRPGMGYVAKLWPNTNGNNSITLKWYQNGAFSQQGEYPLPLPPAGKTEDMAQGTVGGMVYNQPGSDKVEIYWGNQLAWTIYFTVK